MLCYSMFFKSLATISPPVLEPAAHLIIYDHFQTSLPDNEHVVAFFALRAGQNNQQVTITCCL